MLRFLLIFLSIHLTYTASSSADSISDNPIVFVTMPPNPADFGTLAATFGNHVANPSTAFRGGDLWIRYPDGSLKNLTAAAGYGNSGFQGAAAIAVRDPSPNWEGNKIIFSMVVGAPTQQYQLGSYRWQLYEISGLGPSETPIIVKVPNQPSAYNNHSPVYGSDDKIIFVSDRPRDNSVLHTYPQRDEYESSPVNTGLWKLNPQNGDLSILDHAPSGDFNPSVDSFGRVIFTRWDHLQRDQQNIGASLGAYNFENEISSTKLQSAQEIFPEPRSSADPDKKPNVNLFSINHFLPWMMNQDGTELETLNHIGRQEIGLYVERSFNDDPNVEEFYGQYSTGNNQNEFNIFLHIKENPTNPGNYLGINCQEFGTHSGGQIISISGTPGMNPDNMIVSYLTHPDTSGASDTPSGNHSGLYRDPLPLSNGNLLASHTTNTRQDSNIGSGSNPLSRYDYRIKLLSKPGSYFTASSAITSGISKSISFWNPDQMVSYNGPLWEMMPVELKSRARPQSKSTEIPAIEAEMINSLGINVEDLTNYLRSQNLALVVSRNVTTRDKNDKQQPTNLKVEGSNTQSIPHSGKVYDISRLEFFQGDLIRGYGSSSNNGRRVLAQRMHSVQDGVNPDIGSLGSTQIADDGSMAAFVPASRALSWQLASSSGEAVVRERFWVTFQPGEIRVCASCHGINTADHLGNTAPKNPPQALAKLLAHWKNLPPPTFTPVPAPTAPGESEDPVESKYSIEVQAQNLKAKSKFTLVTKGQKNDKLIVKASINSKLCANSKELKGSGESRRFKGKFPLIPGAKINFVLFKQNSEVAKTRVLLQKTKQKFKRASTKDACRALIASLR